MSTVLCPIKQVKHYFLTWAGVAKWVASKMDSHTARIRVSSASKHFRQMHEKINIFYTALVQNTKNRKLYRQVDSVDAGLNRKSNSHVFYSVGLFSHFIAYIKASKEKLFLLRMIEFLLLLSRLQ